VVGDQVGGQPERTADLTRRGVAEGESIHDGQTDGLAQGGVDPRPELQPRKLNIH
jgi:hypothetical protein